MLFDVLMLKAMTSKGTDEMSKILEYSFFARIVNDYDMWIHEYPESKEFNQLFYLIGRDRYVARMLDNPKVELTSKERILLDVENEKKQRYLEKINKNVMKSGEIGIVFAEDYTSELGHYILEQNQQLKGVVVINMAMSKVSLRSIPDYDISPIAVSYGGGGHKNACGFELKFDKIQKILDAIFDIKYESPSMLDR